MRRVWRMLDRAEYKRRQAPPGVKITRRAFGRDRRYPITNGVHRRHGRCRPPRPGRNPARADPGRGLNMSEKAHRRRSRARFHPRHHRRRSRVAGRVRHHRHALSARAQRLSPYRPCQVDLPQFRHRPGIWRALPSALRRHQSGEGRAGIYRRHQRDVRWLGYDWGTHLHHASDYFDQLYEWAEHLIERRPGLCRRSDRRTRCRRTRGTLTRAGPRQPVTATAASTRISISSAACARASSRTARACCAPRSTWRRAISICATRCCTASSTRSIRAPARRGASIRPTISRMASRTRSRASRHSLCTLEFEDHRPLYDWFLDNLPVPSRPRQYEFARLNIGYTVLSKRVLTRLVRREACRRLGRSAHADARRAAAARRSAGGDPRFHPEGRCRARQLGRRYRDVRSRGARPSQQDRAAPHGGAAAAEGRDRELRRAGRGARRGQPPRRSGGGHAAHSVRPRDLYRARRFHGEPAEEILPLVARAPRCGCAMPISSPAARW